MFRYRKPYSNPFERNYRSVKDNDGRIVNKCVGEDNAKSRWERKRKRMIGDYSYNKNSDEATHWQVNSIMHICEFLVAVTLSVAIHTMSFENGGKKLIEHDNFDSPDFDYFNYFFRNLMQLNEHPNLKLLLQRQDDIKNILNLNY